MPTILHSSLPWDSRLWPDHSVSAPWTLFWDRPVRLALSGITSVETKRILVVGCGDSPVAAELVRRGARVVAFDLSASALAAAGSTAPGPWYIQADAAHMPVRDGGFDVTLSISTLQYMPISRVVEGCRRALRPGGIAVFVENLAGNPVAKMDRLRRRILRTPEPPTMRIRRHLSLREISLFRSHFADVTAHVWYDWSTVLLPLVGIGPTVRRVVQSVVWRTARPVSISEWRSRFGWIISIAARV
jgi:SAM-dependent methyltransferase